MVMLRFIFICTLIFSLYLASIYITTYDPLVTFSVLNYKTQLHLSILILILLIIQLALSLIFKLAFYILYLPFSIKKYLHQKSLSNLNKNILKTYIELLIGNRTQAIEFSKKLLTNTTYNINPSFKNLIYSLTESNFDNKLHYLMKLLDTKLIRNYALKQLAITYSSYLMYESAEKYIEQAFAQDNTDTETLLLLIKIYAALHKWHKMLFIITKLQRTDNKLLDDHKNEFATYYFQAASFFVDKEDKDKANHYLELALNIYHSHLDSLNLFVKINDTSNKGIKILLLAFNTNPSFEIAQIYIKYSNDKAPKLYKTLSNIVPPSKNIALFLAIAAYLKIDQKIIN